MNQFDHLTFSPAISRSLPNDDQRRVWLLQQINSWQHQFLVIFKLVIVNWCKLWKRINSEPEAEESMVEEEVEEEGQGKTLALSSWGGRRGGLGNGFYIYMNIVNAMYLEIGCEFYDASYRTYVSWSRSAIHTRPDRRVMNDNMNTIHSKSKKVCGTAFSVKKRLRKKCIFWGHLEVILGNFWVILDHFGSF